MVWAGAIDGWTIVVCIELEEEDDVGRIIVASPESECTEILLYDAGSASVIDGDTVTMRGVLDWLRALLTEVGQDHALEADEDNPAHGSSLGDSLRFSDRELTLDWRIDGDAVGGPPLRDGYDPELRSRRSEVSAIYERFVRTLIDPGFVARAGPS